MIYLASPYSTGNGNTIEENYAIVAKKVSELMAQNLHVFSPIVHCHHLAMEYDLPKDFGYWRKRNEAWIDMCDVLWVLKMKGWEKSVGVQGEIAYAKSQGKDVHYVEV